MKIAVDFDGVLCDRQGIPREGDFYDCPPTKDALAAITFLCQNYDVYVLTNREEVEQVEGWLSKHGFPQLVVTNRKLKKTIAYIDDRAIRFTNWLDVCKYFG